MRDILVRSPIIAPNVLPDLSFDPFDLALIIVILKLRSSWQNPLALRRFGSVDLFPGQEVRATPSSLKLSIARTALR